MLDILLILIIDFKEFLKLGGLLKEVISPSNFTDAETEGLMNEKLF